VVAGRSSAVLFCADRDSKLPSKEKKKKKKKSKEVPTLSLTSQLAKPSRLLECGI
jgi:hypothetical protein